MDLLLDRNEIIYNQLYKISPVMALVYFVDEDEVWDVDVKLESNFVFVCMVVVF